MSVSRLLIGLGNPGDDYARTRHNIGFMAVDEIAAHYCCPSWKKKFRGLITGADAFLLLKPQTFMNLSGESAVEALRFYQLEPENVVVFHDDIDLLPGQVKIKQGGGSGGHNGLKSLDACIGSDYWRVRIGVGRPMTEQGCPVKGDAVVNYVLNPFTKADKSWLDPLVHALAEETDLLLKNEFQKYLARLPKRAAS
ncbi:MAG: aminoacyl-tRNA hydrolase [Alphaproteobacteria bacterium]|nr:aminoacyl-tRNA hydrolase [Alphaproteobacteria bacterium]